MKLFKSRASLKDVFVGVAGASAAQAISFVLVPVVARLFSPEHFGIAATFLGVFAIVSSISTLRYEQAVLLPKSEKEAKDITLLSLCILCLSVLFSIILLIFVKNYFIDETSFSEGWHWYVLLPLFLFVSGLTNIMISWGTRLKMFGLMATTDAASTLLVSGSRIGSGLIFGSSVSGLLIGSLIGNISKLFLMSGKGVSKIIISSFYRIRPNNLKEMLLKYYDFPVYMAPTGFIREFKENLPLLGLTFLFSAQVVGFYAMASRLVRLPVSVVSMPVRRVYIQKASELIQNYTRELCKLLVKYSLFLFLVGVVPFVLLSLYAEEIFAYVLGDGWSFAGAYAEVMSFWLFSVFILTPSAATFVVMRKQKIWMYFQIAGVLLGIGVFLAASKLNLSGLDALTYFSYVQISINILIFFTAVYITSVSDNGCCSDLRGA